jgi:hypothetical protein
VPFSHAHIVHEGLAPRILHIVECFDNARGQQQVRRRCSAPCHRAEARVQPLRREALPSSRAQWASGGLMRPWAPQQLGNSSKAKTTRFHVWGRLAQCAAGGGLCGCSFLMNKYSILHPKLAPSETGYADTQNLPLLKWVGLVPHSRQTIQTRRTFPC